MAWIVPVVTALAAGASAYSAIKRADATEEAAESNARNIEAETAESARRSREDLDQRLGISRSRVGASGVRLSGSPATYIGAMEAEGTRQINWMQSAGADRARATRKVGELESSAALWGGMGTALQLGAQAGSQFFKLGGSSGGTT